MGKNGKVRRVLVLLALVALVAVFSGCGGGSSREESSAVRVKDRDGIYWCDADDLKYGRCPRNPNFGLTPKQVRAKRAAEAKARRKAERESRKREAAGWNEYAEGIWWKWGDGCTAARSCWT